MSLCDGCGCIKWQVVFKWLTCWLLENFWSLFFSANIDGWGLLLFFSAPPASPWLPWWLYEADKQTRQHVILKDIVRVTLLAGSSCFVLLLLLFAPERDGEEKVEWCCRSSCNSSPDDRSSLCLWATRGIRLEKCEHSSHKQYRQRDRVTADVQELLSRQFGERTASVCQHVAMRQSRLSECK